MHNAIFSRRLHGGRFHKFILSAAALLRARAGDARCAVLVCPCPLLSRSPVRCSFPCVRRSCGGSRRRPEQSRGADEPARRERKGQTTRRKNTHGRGYRVCARSVPAVASVSALTRPSALCASFQQSPPSFPHDRATAALDSNPHDCFACISEPSLDSP